MQHEGTDIKRPASAGNVTRAALLGLCGGVLLGGLLLLGLGLKTRMTPTDCTDLSELECGTTREADQDLSRMQLLSGAALLALGAAVVVLVRSKGSPASH
jgi:hypothetical protein